jgi:oligoribonuclease NrnB/cAMP/cGMP phosphodiesterase (DHH superfamily)
MLQITHHDLDGIASIRVLRYGLKKDIPYFVGGSPAQLDEFLLKQKFNTEEIWITDLAPTKEEVIDLLLEKNPKVKLVRIIDHHPESKWIINVNSTKVIGYHDEKFSGAENLYRYLIKYGFTQGEVPDDYLISIFTKSVTAYDLWLTESPYRKHGEKLHNLLGFFGREFFIDAPIHKLIVDYNDVNKTLIKKKDEYIDRNVESAIICSYEIEEDIVCAVVIAEKNASQIGNEILKKYHQVNFAVIINPIYNGISFRSRKLGYNVSHLARKYGGGGHKSASGCPLNGKGIYFLTLWLRHKYPEFNFKVSRYSGK